MQNEELFDTEKNPQTLAYVIERDTVNIRCNRCGNVVLKTDTTGYSYQCMGCDEDLYACEVHLGRPHTDKELNQLLLDTRDLLLLDS